MRRVAPSTGEKMKLHRRRWHGPHLDHQQTLLRTTPDGSAQGTARLASSAPHMTSFSGPRWMRQVEEQLPRTPLQGPWRRRSHPSPCAQHVVAAEAQATRGSGPQLPTGKNGPLDPRVQDPYSDRPLHALTKTFAFKSYFITIQDRSKMRNPV